eukprot:51275-Pleurochrysis_carterae.AAC.2
MGEGGGGSGSGGGGGGGGDGGGLIWCRGRWRRGRGGLLAGAACWPGRPVGRGSRGSGEGGRGARVSRGGA